MLSFYNFRKFLIQPAILSRKLSMKYSLMNMHKAKQRQTQPTTINTTIGWHQQFAVCIPSTTFMINYLIILYINGLCELYIVFAYTNWNYPGIKMPEIWIKFSTYLQMIQSLPSWNWPLTPQRLGNCRMETPCWPLIAM